MTHTLTVFRRKYYKNNDSTSYRDYEYLETYETFMEAIDKIGLSDNLYKRSSKIVASYNLPDDCIGSKELFIFKYKVSESKQFFTKIMALKDVSVIAKYYLIID